ATARPELRWAVGDAKLTHAGYSYGSYLGATYATCSPRQGPGPGRGRGPRPYSLGHRPRRPGPHPAVLDPAAQRQGRLRDPVGVPPAVRRRRPRGVLLRDPQPLERGCLVAAARAQDRQFPYFGRPWTWTSSIWEPWPGWDRDHHDGPGTGPPPTRCWSLATCSIRPPPTTGRSPSTGCCPGRGCSPWPAGGTPRCSCRPASTRT